MVKVEEMGFTRPDIKKSNHLPPYPFLIEPYQDLFAVINPILDILIGNMNVGGNLVRGIDAFFICEQIVFDIVKEKIGPVPVHGPDAEAVVDLLISDLLNNVLPTPI